MMCLLLSRGLSKVALAAYIECTEARVENVGPRRAGVLGQPRFAEC